MVYKVNVRTRIFHTSNIVFSSILQCTGTIMKDTLSPCLTLTLTFRKHFWKRYDYSFNGSKPTGTPLATTNASYKTYGCRWDYVSSG